MYIYFMFYGLAIVYFLFLEFLCRSFIYGVKTYMWYQRCFGFKGTPLLLRGFLIRHVVDLVQWEIFEIDSCGERRW